MRILREHCAAVGRDPAAIERTISFPIVIRDRPVRRRDRTRWTARQQRRRRRRRGDERAGASRPAGRDRRRPSRRTATSASGRSSSACPRRSTPRRSTGSARSATRSSHPSVDAEVAATRGASAGDRRRPGRRRRGRQAGPRAPGGRRRRADGRRQHRRRPRAPRARSCGPTTTPSCTRWPGSTTASRAGGSRARRVTVAEQLAALRRGDVVPARRPGPRRRTSSGRPGCDAGTGRPRSPSTSSARSGSAATILPMTDEPVRTQVRTDDGWLEFQEYFVHRHQAPTVHAVRFDGVDQARPTARGRRGAGDGADVVVVAPSNPIVSIGPILAVPGMREALRQRPRAGRPDRRGVRIVGRPSAQGTGRPDARLPRPRGQRARRRPDSTPISSTCSCSTGRCGPRAGDRDLGLRTLVTDTIMTDDAARARAGREMLASPTAAGRPRVGRQHHPVDRRPRSTARPTRPSIVVRSCRSAALEGAKSRLGAALDAEERAGLVARACSADDPGRPRRPPRSRRSSW